MKEQAILALIAAVVANGPALGADLQKLIAAVTSLLRGDPGATAAQIQQQISSALADAAAADKAVEQAGA